MNPTQVGEAIKDLPEKEVRTYVIKLTLGLSALPFPGRYPKTSEIFWEETMS